METKNKLETKNPLQTKIIAVLKEKGEQWLFSKERIEKLLKISTGQNLKLEIVTVDVVTHGDCESSWCHILKN